jgi:adenylate kinase
MFNFILLGPPGAGKGTQAIRLCEKYHFKHLATGDLLRAAIEAKTATGLQAKSFIERGALVPSKTVANLIFEAIEQTPKDTHGFLFDGYPRNNDQCNDLETYSKETNLVLQAVLMLTVDKEELIKRMLARGRKDDTEDVIRNRFDVYENETKPVIDYYAQKNIVHTLDGMGPVDDVFGRIQLKIETLK